MLGEIMRKESRKVNEWLERPSLYDLSKNAGLSTPDSPTSPGGKWLIDVWNRIEWMLDEKDDYSWDELQDRIYEEADSAVPVYTHNLWEVWIDLQGYNHPETYENYMVAHMGEMLIKDLDKIPQASLYDAARSMFDIYVGMYHR